MRKYRDPDSGQELVPLALVTELRKEAARLGYHPHTSFAQTCSEDCVAGSAELIDQLEGLKAEIAKFRDLLEHGTQEQVDHARGLQ